MSVSYLYSVARVRYKETTLMDDAAINQLRSQKDAASIRALLAQRGWEDSSDDAGLIASARAKLREEINELAEDDPAVNVFFTRSDFHNLKAAIKKSFSERKNVNVFLPGSIDIELMEQCAENHDYSALPEYLRDAADSADEAIGKYNDPFLCDAILDKASVECVYERAQKSDSHVAKLYARNMLLKSAVKIALRSRGSRTIKKNAELIASGGLFDPIALCTAAEAGIDELIVFLRKQKCADAADALSEGFEHFEDALDNELVREIRPQKFITSSVDPILAYMLARENEIKNVFLLLRAKESGISDETVRERLRESYV